MMRYMRYDRCLSLTAPPFHSSLVQFLSPKRTGAQDQEQVYLWVRRLAWSLFNETTPP